MRVGTQKKFEMVNRQCLNISQSFTVAANETKWCGSKDMIAVA